MRRAIHRDVEHVREIIQVRFKALRIESRLRDQQAKLMRELMDVRLHDMNALRNETREIQKQSVGRDEYKSEHQRIIDQVSQVWKFIYIGIGAGVILQMLIGSMIVYFLRAK
jgi:hypothetical protein